ncbi:MAG TPA: hypothetical protein VJ691_18720 [Vicinamibacterales bacterium]|nr:hypothetical protein [Vicinamibacterales bacterium]
MDPISIDPPPTGVIVNLVRSSGGVGAVGGESTTPRVQPAINAHASTAVKHLDRMQGADANGAPDSATRNVALTVNSTHLDILGEQA